MDVLVEVEGGDDHDSQRVVDVGPGQEARRLDAVEFGHADVEQADVGAQVASPLHGLASVRHLGDDLDAGLGVEDHRQARPHEILVVGDEDPDHAGTPAFGNVATTAQPPLARGPDVKVPPSSLARSLIPRRP